MLQGLHSSEALGRIPLAHVSHQVYGICTGIGDQLLQRGGAELRETELHLGCQLHALRPVLLRGGAHHAADLVYLICLHSQDLLCLLSK